MIDAFRNLFGDMLSGKMKDAEISLTRQESANLRMKIDGLIEEGTKLRDERAVLISKLEVQRVELAEKASLIADLTAKLEERNPVGDGLDEEETKILQFFFEAQRASSDDAARACGLTLPVASHHTSTLLKAGFLTMRTYAMGGTPAKLGITHEGSSYIMKKG